MSTPLLNITHLSVTLDQKQILNGLNLKINTGETHVIMGPNGSGKSTLAYTLTGHPDYQDTQGAVLFNKKPLLTMPPEQRAAQGLFLSFQNPTAIPGVNNMYFMRQAVNAIGKMQNKAPIDAYDFMKTIKTWIKTLDLPEHYLERNLNEGFSGGEKKCNEMLQMLLLQPELALLDEIDSGLDIDALQRVAKGINLFKATGKSILMITHYQRLLDYVTPDFVHVLYQGKIIHTGDASLAKKIEKEGYQTLIQTMADTHEAQ